MLHSEPHSQHVVEAVFFLELRIESRIIERLEEKNNQLRQSAWVFICHCQMSITFEAAIVALDQEGEGEGIVFVRVFNVRDNRNFPDLYVSASGVGIDRCDCNIDLFRWEVLVQIDNLDILRLLFTQADQFVHES